MSKETINLSTFHQNFLVEKFFANKYAAFQKCDKNIRLIKRIKFLLSYKVQFLKSLISLNHFGQFSNTSSNIFWNCFYKFISVLKSLNRLYPSNYIICMNLYFIFIKAVVVEFEGTYFISLFLTYLPLITLNKFQQFNATSMIQIYKLVRLIMRMLGFLHGKIATQ